VSMTKRGPAPELGGVDPAGGPRPTNVARSALKRSIEQALSRTPEGQPLDYAALMGEARRDLGALSVSPSVVPYPVKLPFDLPPRLRLSAPHVFPAERQTKRRLGAWLRDLGSTRPEKRRGAAIHLGGWPAGLAIDEPLADHLGDPDAFTRSTAALGLAVHGALKPAEAATLATNLVDATTTDRGMLAQESACNAVLAAAVVAKQFPEPDTTATVVRLAEDLASRQSDPQLAAALRVLAAALIP
jgi:hypothetical protein